MIKPKVGICTAVLKGFNLDENDSTGYQDELIKAVKNMDFDTIIGDELISTPKIAEDTARLFNKEDVDLYILHLGTFIDDPRVMPLITRVNKPFIIWAHDINPFNISITGAQNIMPNIYDLGLDYRFIYGRFDDKKALNELYKFSRTCAIKNKLAKTKIGYVGGHPNIMTSLTADEIAVKKIFGITLVNFGNEEIILGSSQFDKKESAAIWNELKGLAGKVDAAEDLGLATSSTLGYILKLVKENSLDAISINCFPHLKGNVCMPIARLNDLGIPAGCEGDLDSTILMYILYNLSGRSVSNGDQLKVFNLDKPNNSLMFSHCGAGAFSLAASKDEIIIHEYYETGKGIAAYFPERIPGEVTVASMHGTRDSYRMFITKGNALDTNLIKYYEGNPINIQFDFNIRDMFKEIANRGFGHHWNIGYGNHVDELVDLCKLLKINYTFFE
jgi:L-fucose isomerase-like protein